MRFLTRQQKKYNLEYLEELYKTATPEKNTGGSVTLDSPLVPYLKRLNKVFGLATTYSCSGHTETPGMIELRLTKKNMKLFDFHIAELMREESIMEAGKFYGWNGDPRRGAEIVESVRIRFCGEVNGVPLDKPLSHIIKFFEKICVPSIGA